MNIKITLQKKYPDALVPELKTQGSAGYDLFAYCPEGIWLPPLEPRFISTGIKMALPEGYDAEVRPRSGLSNKHLILIPNSPGTIDSDYRGEILVGMLNLGEQSFKIEHNMRIAQLVVRKSYYADFFLAEDLDATERGEGGFGSTGLF
jgi:dUTP pyrophosphatase